MIANFAFATFIVALTVTVHFGGLLGWSGSCASTAIAFARARNGRTNDEQIMFLPGEAGEVARRRFRTSYDSALSATEGSEATTSVGLMTPPSA